MRKQKRKCDSVKTDHISSYFIKAKIKSGLIFLIGKIPEAAAGRSCASGNSWGIHGSISVCADQPHSVKSRDQTDPHTGQSAVHIKDQRKSRTCMERQ